ncbi:unnamed protein product [Staurois parvus]|uniref:Uncharacterized protein n=1 Tax=Staurois parvus TaxID=386267 RepID=A0ABN9FD98_9NEOB|nr:unnamed protein product [Staurois parvus]
MHILSPQVHNLTLTNNKPHLPHCCPINLPGGRLHSALRSACKLEISCKDVISLHSLVSSAKTLYCL